MILEGAGAHSTKCAPTVVVVGAGIAGICVWDQLRSAGCQALLLDAGPAELPPGELAEGYVPDEEAWRFQVDGEHPTWIRVFAVGGRAHVWGRWCNRFSEGVFSRWDRRGWAVPRDELRAAYARAEAWLGTVDEPVPARFAGLAADFGTRLVGRRVADAERSRWLEALHDARAQARTHTVGLRLVTDAARALALEVVTGERTETVAAAHFVLAASPLETARLLLASGATHPAVGRNLTDHLCLGYTLVEPRARSAPHEAALIRSAAEPSDRGGYVIEVLGPLRIDTAAAEFLCANGLRVEPEMSSYAVLAVGEQFPRAGQRLTLDASERDGLGRPRPRLQLAHTDADRALLEHIRRDCMAVVRRLVRPDTQVAENPSTVEAPRIFHPGGVAAMGPTPDFPTETSGRLRQWTNVWVADASVFPSSGDCHPTLTVVAHAHRVADSLLAEVH